MVLFEKIKTIQKNVDYRKLKFIGGNHVPYDFSDFKTFNDLFEDFRFKKITIDDAKIKQNEFNLIVGNLDNYIRRTEKYTEAKNNLLNNAKKF